jgi:hypothetical protein
MPQIERRFVFRVNWRDWRIGFGWFQEEMYTPDSRQSEIEFQLGPLFFAVEWYTPACTRCNDAGAICKTCEAPVECGGEDCGHIQTCGDVMACPDCP